MRARRAAPGAALHHRVIHQVGAAFHRRQQARRARPPPPTVPRPSRSPSIRPLRERRLDHPGTISSRSSTGRPRNRFHLVVAVADVARHLLAGAREDPDLVDVVPGLMAKTRLRCSLMPHLGRKSVYPAEKGDAVTIAGPRRERDRNRKLERPRVADPAARPSSASRLCRWANTPGRWRGITFGVYIARQ